MPNPPSASGKWGWAVLAVGYALCAGLPAHAGDPPKLDEEELAVIRRKLSSWESVSDWADLKRRGEKVLPYFAHILADHKSTGRQVEQALCFAQKNLIQFDCTSLLETTLSHLQHAAWEIRAEAMILLREIGSREDCAAVVILLHNEKQFNRAGAVNTLAKLGGRRELFVLDQWLGRKGMDEHYAIEELKKTRDDMRERLDAADKKAKPAEPTEADKAVAQFADADAKVRAGAVEALKKVGSRADSTAVVALLHDPDAMVRTAAAEWLGALGGKRELLALEIRIREPKASDDEAFNAMVKAKRSVVEGVEADEKKAKDKDKDPKATPPGKPADKK